MIPTPGGAPRPVLEDSDIRRELTIGMVTNPRSGGNRKGIGEIRGFLARNPGIHHAEAVTPAELEPVLAGFSERGVDLLIVNGGDGTVQAVLTALYGHSSLPRPPVLALLRAGTTSMLARDVGLRGKPSAALSKICAWATDPERSGHRIHERPVLRIVRGADAEPVCGMFFGAGAIVRGIDLWHGSINPSGVRGELMPGVVFARLLLAFVTGNERLLPPVHMGVRLDEAPGSHASYLLALISTLDRLFLALHPFWGDETAPLHFTAVKAKPVHLVRNLPFLLRGRRTATASAENGFSSHNVGRIDLDFRGRFTLDGEVFEANAPLTIEPAGPARFLRI